MGDGRAGQVLFAPLKYINSLVGSSHLCSDYIREGLGAPGDTAGGRERVGGHPAISFPLV